MQIVFERNPSISTVLDDKLPALNGDSSIIDYVARLLRLLKTTRLSYLKAESSNRVQ